jgi:quercetin dioxygenase-like cupin family protein
MSARAILVAAATLAALAAGFHVSVQAQQTPAVKRTILQKQGLQAEGQEGVMALVEIPPGAREGRHTHPAEGFVYVLEGTLTVDMEGKPTATYKAGDSFFIERGKIHEGVNNGTTPVKAVAVFVADKGKPMTTQVK